jgi:hypothetical protein
MTKGQWLLVGALALSLAVGLYICSSVLRNATELPVKRWSPVSQRGDLSQHCDNGSTLITMRTT